MHDRLVVVDDSAQRPRPLGVEDRPGGVEPTARLFRPSRERAEPAQGQPGVGHREIGNRRAAPYPATPTRRRRGGRAGRAAKASRPPRRPCGSSSAPRPAPDAARGSAWRATPSRCRHAPCGPRSGPRCRRSRPRPTAGRRPAAAGARSCVRRCGQPSSRAITSASSAPWWCTSCHPSGSDGARATSARTRASVSWAATSLPSATSQRAAPARQYTAHASCPCASAASASRANSGTAAA